MYFKTTKGTTKHPKLFNSHLTALKVKNLLTASFINGLETYSDANKTIMLSIVDKNYLTLALNFYELSIKRHLIKNFAFVCIDEGSMRVLTNLSLPCIFFDFPNPVKNSLVPSDFGTVTYLYRTNIKTAVMIQALNLEYNVLMVDVDVIIFKNPFPFFTCTNCSIHAQMDRQMYNSGFIFVRPTPSTKKLYHMSWKYFIQYQKGSDQSYLNTVINQLQAKGELLDLQALNKQQFPCGVYYFEHVHRAFENKPPCKQCVMVHNNYIASAAAKLYRLKENHMWVVDDSKYYSNSETKYLTYDNPFTFEDRRTIDVEVETLKIAIILASTLKRILILPAFHCCNCLPDKRCSYHKHRCSLLSVLKINKFDKHFRPLYKEHSFLTNPLVPDKIKTSMSNLLLINSSMYINHAPGFQKIPYPELVLQPRNITMGAQIEEIDKWLKPYEDTSVIKFHSLYGALSSQEFKSPRFTRLRNMFTESFECSSYEQWDQTFLPFWFFT